MSSLQQRISMGFFYAMGSIKAPQRQAVNHPRMISMPFGDSYDLWPRSTLGGAPTAREGDAMPKPLILHIILKNP
jgi:hypothetical protein